MKAARLTPHLSAAHQISVADVEAAAAEGFRTIVNNRPDGEAPDQPSGAQIEEAAERLGLQYRHIPVVSGQLGPGEVDAFRQALAELEGPILAFCRTGTRSTALWALAAAPERPADEILGIAAGAGYDLSGLRPLIEAYGARE